ncbi:MAG: gliding motility-associated ABC transporter ATP-binding subunit GldA [bacterium]|jgi:ABC-2 type transport system ATP-binding protein
MSIKVAHILKTYGTQIAVNDISFEINKGEIVGFLGPNGAGKSTTMKIITGYLRPDSGDVYVCGIPVAGESLATKRKIGYLPESNPLYYEMYVREYLNMMAGLHGLHSPKKRIEEVIALTGLSVEAHKEIGQLSKGYKQRVGLAAALLHDPEVLILDEPTTGLDPNQIIEIREVIRSLSKEKTILFSTHILQEVEALCDRVIVINKGSIVADDRLVNLQQSSAMARVRVSFREKVDQTLLSGVKGVLHANKVNELDWMLETTDPEALSKELLAFTLQHNLNIVSLQTQTRRLEDIFRELTESSN